jgi:hypothetical protein
MTNPQLKTTRDFYGTPHDKQLALVTDEGQGWPAGYQPELFGFRSRFVSTLAERAGQGPPGEQKSPRLLGVRLDRFVYPPDQHLRDPRKEFDAPIELTLYTVAGPAPIGGCSVYYAARRERGQWVIAFAGLLDP